jgi:hypothetical protein
MCDVTRLVKGGPRKVGAMSWRAANWELEKKRTPMDGAAHGRQAPLIKISRPLCEVQEHFWKPLPAVRPIQSILPAFAITTFLDKIG